MNNYDLIKTVEPTDYVLLNPQSTRKKYKFKTQKTMWFMKKKSKLTNLRGHRNRKKCKKKICDKLNRTYLYYNSEVFDYEYLSDSESRRQLRWETLSKKFPTNVDKFCYLTNHFYNGHINRLKENINRKSSNDPQEQDLRDLIDKYNFTKKQNKKSLMNKCNKSAKDSLTQRSSSQNMLKALIDKLKLFRFHHTHDLDDNVLVEYEENNNPKVKNKKFVENIYFQSENGVEKFLPDLISLNILSLIRKNSKIKRRELYEFFVQYKTLMKICICLNRSLTILKKGIDFKTFFNGIPHIKHQGAELAKKIFDTLNYRTNNHLTFEEFVKGMVVLKSKEISEKIEMFLKVRLISLNLDNRLRWKWIIIL